MRGFRIPFIFLTNQIPPLLILFNVFAESSFSSIAAGSQIRLPSIILKPQNTITIPNGMDSPGLAIGKQKGMAKSKTARSLPLPDTIFKIRSISIFPL